MKNYFNADERNRHLQILALWNMISDMLDNATNYTPEEMKYLRTASTYIIKANTSVIQRLDKDFGNKLIKELKDTVVIIESKTKYAVTKQEELKNYVTLPLEEYYNLCEFACGMCKGCKIKDHKNCDRHKFFITYNVPVANENTNDCPYRQ